jgi:hypothetical protein
MTKALDAAAGPFEFQVALQGSFGPALCATFVAMGVQQIRTTSNFLVSVRDGEGICEIVEALEKRGLTILDVRPAALGGAAGR